MPVQQLCTVVGMTRSTPRTYWMTLEVGKMVEELGLRAGQFLHVACGEGSLLRRPISVALAMADEPEDTAALIFEVKGEGTRWLARAQVGDTVDVLGPLGNGFSVEQGGRYLLVGGGIGTPPLLGYAEAFRENAVAVLGFRSADRAILVDGTGKPVKRFTFARMTAARAGTALWTPRCGTSLKRIRTLQRFWPAAPSPC